MSRYIVGIDPGLSGAITFLDPLTGDLFVQDMPVLAARKGGGNDLDRTELARIFDRHDIKQVFLELVGTRPGQAAGAVMRTSRNAGIVEGIVVANYHALDIVAPVAWKRRMGLPSGLDDKARKAAARNRASELMPRCAGLWARAKDDGRAESALIAVYGCRQLGLDLPLIIPGRRAA